MEKKNNNKKRRPYRKKKKKVEFSVENNKNTIHEDFRALNESIARTKAKNYRPTKLTEIEDHVRKGEMLQAVKLFKDITGSPLTPSKEAVEIYRESGNWNHWIFVKNTNVLDLAFKKVCGNTPEEFSKLQDIEIYDRAKKAKTPIVSVNMALRIAVQYAQILGSDEIYKSSKQ